MLQHPVDAPPALPPLSQTEALFELRAGVSSRNQRELSGWLARLRSWGGRVSGRSDRYHQRLVESAVDAVASRCDDLAERVSALSVVVEDVSTSYGVELARLRSEVLHLRRTAASHRDPTEPTP